MTDQTKTPELKPCPFCKKPARSWKQGIIRKNLCACSDNECGAYFTKFTPEEWNTRADTPYPVTKEAARDLLQYLHEVSDSEYDYKTAWAGLTYHLPTLYRLLEAASK